VHDRGSVTPLLAAVISLVALASLAISHVVDDQLAHARAQTAAEAMALGAVLGANLDNLAARYEVDDYDVDHADEYDEFIVTVRIERDGVVEEASAIDHRRTLEPAE
jgi:molybdopterin/thiamine biosynthesis adenylyltransferase